MEVKNITLGKNQDLLPLIARLLIFIVIGLSVYITYQMFKEGASFSSELSAGLANDTFGLQESKPLERKPFAQYAVEFEKRDIFSPAKLFNGSTENGMAKLPDFIQHLKLVGILLGKMPQAVIENLSTKETLFLSLGQAFEGVLVESIQESRVVLTYQGRKIELTIK